MMEFIRSYKAKPWPTVEIPTMKKPQLVLLVLYVAAMVAGGWVIWFSGQIRAEYFGFLGIMMPILFLMKSRYFTIVALLSLQVVMAFLFVGNSDYPIIIVACLAGAIIAFQSPMLMYVFLIFAIWFDTSAFVTGLSLRLEFTIGLGLLLGWVFKEVLKYRATSRPIKYFPKWPVIFFLLWAIAGFSLWSYEPFPAGWDQTKRIITHILFFLITPLIIRERRQLTIIIWTWLIVGLIAAAATVVAPYLGFSPESSGGWGGGTSVFAWHKNVSASFLSLSIFVTYALFLRKRKLIYKFGLFICMLIDFVAIFNLGSKSAMIGLFIGVLFLNLADTFWVPQRRNTLRMLRNTFIIVSFAIIMILIIYVVDISQTLLGTYNDIFTSGTHSGSMEMRKILWDASWDIIANENHPIRGLGPGAFWVLGLDYVPVNYFLSEDTKGENPAELTGQTLMLQTHSLYVDIFLHYGVIGSFFFVWFCLYVILNLWKRSRSAIEPADSYLFLGLLAAIIAFLVHGLLDFSLYNSGRFWLFCGLCVAALSILNDKEQDNGIKPMFNDRL